MALYSGIDVLSTINGVFSAVKRYCVQMASKKQIVVICVDESASANFAFDWYATNFHRSDHYVIAVHCPETFTNVTMMSPGRVTELIKECNAKLDCLRMKYDEFLNKKNVTGRFEVIGLDSDSKPGQAVVDYAEKAKASFIVTGTRGMGKFRRTVMGSVSDYIVHHAPCPVLVCRHKADKEKEKEKH